MFYRCELLINGLRYRVTDDLENWDEVKASFKRNDYDGVIRTFSNKFSFAGDARRLLLKQYDEDYLNASASIIIVQEITVGCIMNGLVALSISLHCRIMVVSYR